MFINFNELPNVSDLFTDYLYNFPNVAKYYHKNFRNPEDVDITIKNIQNENYHHNKEIAAILLNQYKDEKPSAQTSSNIESLKSKNTFAIVTGQQLGLFGGPLFTIYKTITTIKLCQTLKEKYSDYSFVPVFWLEGEDHDFDEIRSVGIIDSTNTFSKITYNDNLPPDQNHGSVGKLSFNLDINFIHEELSKQIRHTEYTDELFTKLKSSYQYGKTFKSAFKELLRSFFDEYGLIIFDPLDPATKNILKPIFSKEITNFREHSEILIKSSAELEIDYHAQVKVRPINLFMIENDGRYPIEPSDKNDEFRLKGKRHKYTLNELLDLIDTHPEKFSPNVLLRPVCQDALFPTLFYVGGPGEIAYFAQVSHLYELFGIEQPIIYPRASATILESNLKQLIEKYELSIKDILSDKPIIDKILSSFGETDIEQTFNDFSNEINEIYNKYGQVLLSIEDKLADNIIKSKDNSLRSLDLLKARSLDSYKRKHEVIVRQLEKIYNILYPNSNFQERELNWIYFVNKYGLSCFHHIFNELSINKFEHQIIDI